MANDTTRMEAEKEQYIASRTCDGKWIVSHRGGNAFAKFYGSMKSEERAVEYAEFLNEQSQVTSLQRELAEARAEIAGYELFVICVAEDCGDEEYKAPAKAIRDRGITAYQESRVSAPAPSDVKGEEPVKPMDALGRQTIARQHAALEQTGRELDRLRAEIESLKSRASLTPLTDPSVRGVLVDDGEPRIIQPDEMYLEPDGELGEWSLTTPSRSKLQPVKLRPASEVGVAAKEDGARSAMSRRELEQRHQDAIRVHHDLQKLAESLDVKEWDVAGTGLLVRLVKERVGQLVHEYRQMSDGLQAAKNAQKLTRGMFSKTIAALADALGKKGPFDESRTATIALGLIQMVQELVAARGEPGLKKLEPGWKVLRPARDGHVHDVFVVAETVGPPSFAGYFEVVDPALYAIPDGGGRIKELEAKLAALSDVSSERLRGLEQYRQDRLDALSDAERLRKAIEEAVSRTSISMHCTNEATLRTWAKSMRHEYAIVLVEILDHIKELRAALAPSPAAANQESDMGYRNTLPDCIRRDTIPVQMAVIPEPSPAAASVETAAHLDNEDRKDLLELWNHFKSTADHEEMNSAAEAITEILENKPGHLLTLDGVPTSAPAAESEPVTPLASTAAAVDQIQSGMTGSVDERSAERLRAARGGAESEGGEKPTLKALATLTPMVTADIDKLAGERDALSARLAACEGALQLAYDTLEMVPRDEETQKAGLWQGKRIPRVLKLIEPLLAPKSGGEDGK